MDRCGGGPDCQRPRPAVTGLVPNLGPAPPPCSPRDDRPHAWQRDHPNSNRAEIFIRLRTKTESDLKAHVITTGRAIYRMLCSFFQTVETVNPYELTDMTKLTLANATDLGAFQAKWDDMLLKMRLSPPSTFKLDVYKSQIQRVDALGPGVNGIPPCRPLDCTHRGRGGDSLPMAMERSAAPPDKDTDGEHAPIEA